MSETILEVRDLVIDIPVASGMLHPVQSISFEVKKGETLCIVGESGCGKSTLARLQIGSRGIVWRQPRACWSGLWPEPRPRSR